MNERGGQFGVKYAREIVGPRKAYKNERKNEQRQSYEEIILSMFPNWTA